MLILEVVSKKYPGYDHAQCKEARFYKWAEIAADKINGKFQ